MPAKPPSSLTFVQLRQALLDSKKHDAGGKRKRLALARAPAGTRYRVSSAAGWALCLVPCGVASRRRLLPTTRWAGIPAAKRKKRQETAIPTKPPPPERGLATSYTGRASFHSYIFSPILPRQSLVSTESSSCGRRPQNSPATFTSNQPNA